MTTLLSLFLLLTAAALAAGRLCAQQVYLDFDQHPAAAQTQGVSGPHVEDGFTLSNTLPGNPNYLGGFFLPGPQSTDIYTGMKTFIPANHPSAQVRIILAATNGSRFSLKSLRLHPYRANQNVSITFVADDGNGNLRSHTAQTGSTLAGTVIPFSSQFDDVVSVSWDLFPNSSPSSNRHQISDMLMEFQSQLSTPGAFTVNESSGTLAVPLRLSAPRSADVLVPYTVNPNSATAGSDYSNPGNSASGTALIPAGQTVANVLIPILNDTTVESPESFSVMFHSAPPGTVFSPGGLSSIVSFITIASDDGIANFAGWMSAHGLTGNAALPNADPNGDGVSNIESWLHRINPAGPSPAAWLDRRASFFTTAGNVPGLRLTIPTPLPSDVRLIFEETTALSTWSEQTRRSGFATGSLWTGTGASRVVEANTLAARTITFPGSATRSARPHAYYRMKYELVSTGND